MLTDTHKLALAQIMNQLGLVYEVRENEPNYYRISATVHEGTLSITAQSVLDMVTYCAVWVSLRTSSFLSYGMTPYLLELNLQAAKALDFASTADIFQIVTAEA